MDKILIVDDNGPSRELMRAILKTVRCDIIEGIIRRLRRSWRYN